MILAFPGMLVNVAEKAGIKVPPDPDNTPYDKLDYPHFEVFCNIQLCRSTSPGEASHNAEVIAAIPDNKITKVTMNDLIDLGVWVR